MLMTIEIFSEIFRTLPIMIHFAIILEGLGRKRTRKVAHRNLAHGYFEYVVLSSCFHINKSQLNKKIASFIIEEFVSVISIIRSTV